MRGSAKKVKDEARQRVIARRKVLRKQEQRRQGVPQVVCADRSKRARIDDKTLTFGFRYGMNGEDLLKEMRTSQVWVNLDSKIYYRHGSSRYENTKRGKLMPESEAVAAGYREAKP